MNTNTDLIHLNHALELAKLQCGFCSPNPSVGAVLVNHSNEVIATGYHLGSGSPHAEMNALQKLSMRAHGATIYITLEPCCHWGKTPPCTDALIQSGIKRVVYGYRDPNPLVYGKSESLLQAAGIICEFVSVPEIDAFYESYHHWQINKRPFITAKIALSLNGMIAGKSGERIQITGPELQEFTHFFRKSTDAILTTINTIRYDDPQLNVRYQNQIFSKPIYILDSDLQLPRKAAIFNTAQSITVFHGVNANLASRQELLNLSVRCIAVDSSWNGLNLHQVVHLIGQDGIHSLWIEAGGECFASFVAEKLLQRAFIYIAPRWLHEGKIAFTDGITLDENIRKLHWRQIGNDVLCEIRW